MAETLGSLIDKLIIVNLKQIHTNDQKRFTNLRSQKDSLVREIDQFISCPPRCLVVPANKVYEGNVPKMLEAQTLGGMVTLLTEVNCYLWHKQEQVYDFVNVPADEKDGVIQSIATLNLQRNQCIEKIDREFERMLCTQK